MIRIKKKEKPLYFLISVDEGTLDIVSQDPIEIDGVQVHEFSFELSYFWDWVVRRALNIRVENRYDKISETTTQTVRVVGMDDYMKLTEDQHRNHIRRFINEYKNQTQ